MKHKVQDAIIKTEIVALATLVAYHTGGYIAACVSATLVATFFFWWTAMKKEV